MRDRDHDSETAMAVSVTQSIMKYVLNEGVYEYTRSHCIVFQVLHLKLALTSAV